MTSGDLDFIRLVRCTAVQTVMRVVTTTVLLAASRRRRDQAAGLRRKPLSRPTRPNRPPNPPARRVFRFRRIPMSTTFDDHWRELPEDAWRWPNCSPAEIACRGAGKLLINEPALGQAAGAAGPAGQAADRPIRLSQPRAHPRAFLQEVRTQREANGGHDAHPICAKLAGGTGFGRRPVRSPRCRCSLKRCGNLIFRSFEARRSINLCLEVPSGSAHFSGEAKFPASQP